MSHMYGALPLYQIHFIIKGRRIDDTLLARTRHRRGNRLEVWWEGSILANELNSDKELISLLERIITQEGDIFIDPLKDSVRIYSRWRSQHSLKLSNDAIKAYNIIAKHVKRHIGR